MLNTAFLDAFSAWPLSQVEPDGWVTVHVGHLRLAQEWPQNAFFFSFPKGGACGKWGPRMVQRWFVVRPEQHYQGKDLAPRASRVKKSGTLNN